jgi:hypothetical protein
VVASPSVIDNFIYSFEIPLSKILSLPKIVLNGSEKKEGVYLKKVVKYEQVKRYRGQGISCISQIKDRNLQVGERDNSLYILYNLLLQNNNTSKYSKNFISKKNLSLTEPLPEKEIKNIFKKAYKFSCSKIREVLPYINCEYCHYKFSEGKFKMSNILIHNLRKLPERIRTNKSKDNIVTGNLF